MAITKPWLKLALFCMVFAMFIAEAMSDPSWTKSQAQSPWNPLHLQKVAQKEVVALLLLGFILISSPQHCWLHLHSYSPSASLPSTSWFDFCMFSSVFVCKKEGKWNLLPIGDWILHSVFWLQYLGVVFMYFSCVGQTFVFVLFCFPFFFPPPLSLFLIMYSCGFDFF